MPKVSSEIDNPTVYLVRCKSRDPQGVFGTLILALFIRSGQSSQPIFIIIRTRIYVRLPDCSFCRDQENRSNFEENLVWEVSVNLWRCPERSSFYQVDLKCHIHLQMCLEWKSQSGQTINQIGSAAAIRLSFFTKGSSCFVKSNKIGCAENTASSVIISQGRRSDLKTFCSIEGGLVKSFSDVSCVCHCCSISTCTLPRYVMCFIQHLMDFPLALILYCVFAVPTCAVSISLYFPLVCKPPLLSFYTKVDEL